MMGLPKPINQINVNKSSQNLAPNLYISSYTWRRKNIKKNAYTFLSHFDNIKTFHHRLKIAIFTKMPFLLLKFECLSFKMKKNSLLITISWILAIIQDFTALWTMKNKEMVIFFKLSIFSIYFMDFAKIMNKQFVLHFERKTFKFKLQKGHVGGKWQF